MQMGPPELQSFWPTMVLLTGVYLLPVGIDPWRLARYLWVLRNDSTWWDGLERSAAQAELI